MISMFKKYRPFFVYGLLVAVITGFLPEKGHSNDNGNAGFPFSDGAALYNWVSGDPLPLWMASTYPTDPTADIPWSCGFSGRDSIACAFNNARATENAQLGTALPMLTLPVQAEWDVMDEAEKALWLINPERSDRGIDPFEQIEANVTDVAQTYADYLLDNDAWGHYEDGRSPWVRLQDNPEIGACHDNLSVAENLAVFVSTGSIPLPVERSVYMWMYDDAGSSWGHRHALLWYPYTDNSGLPGMEGFLGIGRASGGPYQGPFDREWPSAEMIVMNVFDPCETWEYNSTTTSFLSSSSTTSPASSSTTTSMTQTTSTSSYATSTSIPPGITTTTVTVLFACPLQYLYGESSEEVLLLRWFRDHVLRTTPEGKQIIRLYYQWSPLLLKAMEEDDALQEAVKEVVDQLLRLLRADMKGIMRLESER